MKHVLYAIPVILVLVGCGGGGDASSNETAQGGAKLWLEAAVNGDLAKLRELTVDDYEQTALKVAQSIRDDQFSLEYLGWVAGGEVGGQKEWSAAQGPRIVTLRLREVTPGNWQVSDASTSW
jgi:hypothetical protein